MTTSRDVQRARVYKADSALAPFKTGDDLSTVPAIRSYLIKVCKRERLRKHFPFLSVIADELKSERIRIHDGGGTTHARGGYSSLNFPLWSRTDNIVLHEFAHMLHRREPWFNREWLKERSDPAYQQSHGWRFAQILYTLALHVLGRDAANAYKAACKEHKVKMRPKRKLSPEQLEALRERGRQLAAARPRPQPRT